MKRSRLILFSLFVVISMVMSACQPAATATATQAPAASGMDALVKAAQAEGPRSDPRVGSLTDHRLCGPGDVGAREWGRGQDVRARLHHAVLAVAHGLDHPR